MVFDTEPRLSRGVDLLGESVPEGTPRGLLAFELALPIRRRTVEQAKQPGPAVVQAFRPLPGFARRKSLRFRIA